MATAAARADAAPGHAKDALPSRAAPHCRCDTPSLGASTARGDTKGDRTFPAVQGKAWWRQRPHVLAMVAVALLGSAGLASTWSGPLRRSSAGKHKHLMSQVWAATSYDHSLWIHQIFLTDCLRSETLIDLVLLLKHKHLMLQVSGNIPEAFGRSLARLALLLAYYLPVYYLRRESRQLLLLKNCNPACAR